MAPYGRAETKINGQEGVMLTKHYPFERGGPERLEISWGATRWTPCTVTVDGAVLATCNKTALVEGIAFRLSDGAILTVRFADLFGRQLEVLRDGVPVPGSVSVRMPPMLVYYYVLLGLLVGPVCVGIGLLSTSQALASALALVFFLMLGLIFLAPVGLAASGLTTGHAWRSLWTGQDGGLCPQRPVLLDWLARMVTKPGGRPTLSGAPAPATLLADLPTTQPTCAARRSRLLALGGGVLAAVVVLTSLTWLLVARRAGPPVGHLAAGTPVAGTPVPVGAITEFPLPPYSAPHGIVTGPDGALWFTESDKIGRITTKGAVTDYPLPSSSGGDLSHHFADWEIARGPDGALWFTEGGTNLTGLIGRITTRGAVTEYRIPFDLHQSRSFPVGIARGPDGALWFTDWLVDQIGRITTSGAITKYPIPSHQPASQIARGPDDALWFTEGGQIGRITTSGVVTEYRVASSAGSSQGRDTYAIASGPDGALWFTEDGTGLVGQIGRITTGGVVTEYPLPSSSGCDPRDIASGPDGALWFTEHDCNGVNGNSQIGRITTSGVVTEYRVASSAGSSLGSSPAGIASGPDGALWFTDLYGGQIGRITTRG